MFGTDIDSLLPDLGQQDQQRLRTAWYEILNEYVTTPRSVRRLINGFAVALGALTDHIDPIDLLVLEGFRLFDPPVYSYIRDHIADLWE